MVVVHNHPSGNPTPSPKDLIRADTSACPYATLSSASSATSASRKEGWGSGRLFNPQGGFETRPTSNFKAVHGSTGSPRTAQPAPGILQLPDLSGKNRPINWATTGVAMRLLRPSKEGLAMTFRFGCNCHSAFDVGKVTTQEAIDTHEPIDKPQISTLGQST
jgi:hypothetical protein